MFLAALAATSLALPTAVAFGVTSSASASSSVTCKKVSGVITGTITIKSCKPKNAADKTLSGNAGLLAGGGTLTWAPSGDTTVVSSITTTSPGQGACKTGSTEFDSTGTVTGGTSTYTIVGDTLSSRTCVSTKTNKISLVKGTTLTL
jgi:hypothetical protein